MHTAAIVLMYGLGMHTAAIASVFVQSLYDIPGLKTWYFIRS